MFLANELRKNIHDMGTKFNSIYLGTKLLRDTENDYLTEDGKDILKEIMIRLEQIQDNYSYFSNELKKIESKEDVEISLLSGKEIIPYIEEISKLRINIFSTFPYLYSGNLEYEKTYMEGFSKDPKSLLAIAKKDGKVIACFSGLPLESDADILKDCDMEFKNEGYKSSDFYYLGECIVLPEYRGLSLSKKMEDLIVNEIKSFGFTKICFATVIREDYDPRRPKGYWSSDLVWRKLGYEKKETIKFEYNWPTILEDGKVEDRMNPMVFWVKESL